GDRRSAGGGRQPGRGRPRHIRDGVVMSRRFEVRLPLERAYTREAMLAVELLDSVTLERITQGPKVTAKGLAGKPVMNAGGLFVWRKEDTSKFEKLIVEPGDAPFESVEIPAAQVNRPIH